MESCQLNLVCWALHPDWSWLQNAHRLGSCWWQISSISLHNIVYIHLHWTWFTRTTITGVKPGSEYFCQRVMLQPEVHMHAAMQKKKNSILSCNVLQHASDSFYMHFRSQCNASKNTVNHALLYRPNPTDWTDADTAMSLTQLRLSWTMVKSCTLFYM